MSDHDVEIPKGVQTHDLTKIISSPIRDYLIRNNGEQVKIDSLTGKKVGLYFSVSWCGPCKVFTSNLVEVYDQVKSKGDFEVIFVSGDRDEKSFESQFSHMPWLAIPFTDSEVCRSLDSLFDVKMIPYLVFIDESGAVVTKKGVDLIREYGVDAYPFSVESMTALKEEVEEAKRNQSLVSLLVSNSCDFVVSSDGNKIPVSSLQGKTVGLYFSDFYNRKSKSFNMRLVRAYKEIAQAYPSSFEVVMLYFEHEEEYFKNAIQSVPWLSLPFMDKRVHKLASYFDIYSLSDFEIYPLPTLVIIAPDGKTLQADAVKIVREYGSIAYPFTSEWLARPPEELYRLKLESQTLESILVSDGLDFVIGKDGVRVPVSDLVGKTILIFFSAHDDEDRRPPCTFLPGLIEAYKEIKVKDSQFEVIFVSWDDEQAEFDDFFATMPWLALPFQDERMYWLEKVFEVRWDSTLVAIGTNGQTISTDVTGLVDKYGWEAYPFTHGRVEEVEKEMVNGLAERVKLESHPHELVLTKRRDFTCDECDTEGKVWSYFCAECEYDVHLVCALQDEKNATDDGDDGNKVEDLKVGWVCDGEVCHKA